MIGEETVDSVCLIIWHSEEVTESSSTEDYLLASSFWVIHSGPRVDLSRTNGGKEPAGDRETGVEAHSILHWLI